MHNINHKWSMAVFESILFHVFLIAFLVAAGSFFMASLPESSPIEVDLVDTTAGASGGAGSGSGHGSSVSKSDTVNVNQLPGGESKDSSAVSSDGTLSKWSTATLTFKNGILISGAWSNG